MSLSNSRVLLIGGTGFIGSRLARQLLLQARSVVLTVRNLADSALLERQGFETHLGDVNFPETITPVVKGCDVVFYLAAGSGSLQDARRINVEGTRAVLQAAIDNSVERFVYASTVAVYGETLPERVTEDFPLTTAGLPYTVSKVEAEKLILEYEEKYQAPVVIVRPTLVFGPGSANWTTGIIDRLKYDKIFLIGNGQGIANLIYVDDLVELLIKVSSDERALGRVFHGTNPELVTWKEYLYGYADLLGKRHIPEVSRRMAPRLCAYCTMESRFTRLSPPINIYDIGLQTNRTIFDAEKAKTILQFEPKIGLKEGLRKIESWLREEGMIAPTSRTTFTRATQRD